MATVYVAQDLRLSRTVALKVMNEGLGDAEDFAHRFDTEARAAAHLTHPNVVSVFDQGNDHGRPYIVMEFVEGWTLRQLITREAPMDPQRVLDLMEPVASALAAAHAAGIVHRDVKPENVLISDRGLVKVADFGLARAVTAQSNAATTGLVIGTVSYIAPELVTKGRADARSDVYSFGIVLYEMLTGHKPHTGESPIQVAYSHVHHQIPAPSMELSTTWRESRAGIPPYLDALVTTAANKDRALRPADAGVLLAHLRDARDALVRGVTDDPALTARMRETALPAVDHATAAVPTLAPVADPPERQFTPVTPVSPSFDVSSDGAPFYSSGPVAYSPQSPHTRTLPAVDPDAPRPVPARPARSRWARILTVLVAIVVIAGTGWGGWYLLEGRWSPVPAVVSMTQEEAEETAAAANIMITFEREYSETMPVGTVIRTVPAPDERILSDATLVAYLSRGPERYPVPDVTGLSLEAATASLTKGLLTLGTTTQEYSDSVPQGSVVGQSLEQGSQVKRDTSVDLVVSLGPAPVDITNFTGRPLTEAQAWADTNAITLKTSEENHDSVPSGSIISQTPSDGTGHRGDSVTLVVSKGPVMVEVPSGLRGLGAEAAAAKLQAAGFKTAYQRVVNGGFGLVLRTDPSEGTMAPRGSTVTLYLV